MKTYGRLGPAAPEAGWVPAPRYLLRRARILRQLEGIAPCETVEIGCGAGVLLHELTARGFRCHALESSPEARVLAGQLAADAGIDIRLVEQPGDDWAGRFPLLMAFEVLEHIEHDREALQAWRSWMPSGATLLLSVPAHMSKWNPSDVWAGHFRRYERRALEALLRASGFEPEAVECYGFPLATVSEKLTARRYARAIKPGEPMYLLNMRFAHVYLHHRYSLEGLIKNIGGKFSEGKTQVGKSMTLEPGTYLINGYAGFDRIDDKLASSPVLQLAIRSESGQEMGTAFTGEFPSGNIEQSTSVTRVVTVDKTTKVNAYVFG